MLSAITLAVALISPLTAPASAQTGGALVERTITLSDAALDNVPQPIPRTALVVAPQDPAPGSPVAVFLAGMHANCTYPSSDGGDITGILFPCPGQTIPNWRGYRYLQRELASRGWITMSVDPNAVNALTANYPDYGASARGQLITSYMADWIRWTNGATSPIPGVLPRADLSSVLLVGHSRGGEGVNAAARTAIGWQARGMFNLAPTMDGMNPAPGIPSVTLLGTCDDDVSDLQGQLFVDGAVGSVRDRAMRSSVLIAHATHNAFNTVWSSDRWNGGNDSRCPNRQLPASIQRKVATAYLWRPSTPSPVPPQNSSKDRICHRGRGHGGPAWVDPCNDWQALPRSREYTVAAQCAGRSQPHPSRACGAFAAKRSPRTGRTRSSPGLRPPLKRCTCAGPSACASTRRCERRRHVCCFAGSPNRDAAVG